MIISMQFLCNFYAISMQFLCKIGEILKLEQISDGMAQTALNYLWAFRNETQNKIASPIQYGKNKFIQFYVVLSFKPVVFDIIFFIKVGISFKDFFILGKMGRASQILAIVALRDMSLTWAQPSGAGLKKIALMVGRKIMPSYPKSLYGSRPRLMKAMVDAQGGHTKYWMCS